MRRPNHLAIIMDGNGRWAKLRGHTRFFGHVRGARVAKTLIEECSRMGIANLTLYAFSTENWNRPSEEVNFLMGLLRRRLSRELGQLIENNIRFQCIGDIERLPEATRREVQHTIEATKCNTGMNLVFALSYGGRQDIAQAARDLVRAALAGELRPEDISMEVFESFLPSHFIPPADLIIRTSGEMRLSNFFLWQAAYSEMYFSEVAWPDFSKEHLMAALSHFARVERRYGQTSEQIVGNVRSLWNKQL